MANVPSLKIVWDDAAMSNCPYVLSLDREKERTKQERKDEKRKEERKKQVRSNKDASKRRNKDFSKRNLKKFEIFFFSMVRGQVMFHDSNSIVIL